LDVCKKVVEEIIVEMIKSGLTSSGELAEKVEALSINSDKQSAESTASTDANGEGESGKLRHTIIMQQVRIVDAKGNLKTVYPSRVDLNFAEMDNKIRVVRLYDDSN
jgi:hypothetical protein